MFFNALCSAIRDSLDVLEDNVCFEEIVEMNFDDNSDFFRIENFSLENDGWILFGNE